MIGSLTVEAEAVLRFGLFLGVLISQLLDSENDFSLLLDDTRLGHGFPPRGQRAGGRVTVLHAVQRAQYSAGDNRLVSILRLSSLCVKVM